MEQWMSKMAILWDPPKIFGICHILLLLFCLLTAISAGYLLRRIGLKAFHAMLYISGIYLVISETVKQIFYVFILRGGRYDTALLPYQLCSIPMYLCFLIPLIRRENISNALECFCVSYNFLGGLMALIFPGEIFSPYILLTVQSVIWHWILLFLGALICFRRAKAFSRRNILASVLFFLCLCLIAVTANYALSAVSITDMRLFFMGPNKPQLPVFDSIYERAGWVVSNLIYLSSVSLGAYLLCIAANACIRRKEKAFSKRR